MSLHHEQANDCNDKHEKAYGREHRHDCAQRQCLIALADPLVNHGS
jgi:hypothetical protein